METLTDLRPSPIAGRWYPGNAERLAASVDEYMDAAALTEIKGEIVAIVAPHAGYIYSGPVAGYAFASIRGMEIDLAVVVSPMHHPFLQPLLTCEHDGYETPLGQVPIDRQAVSALDEYLHEELGYGLTPIRNDPEHSLEIELPFLQQAISGEFKLLPVMMLEQTQEAAKGLGIALAKVIIDRKAIMIASTDLSHFYSQSVANELDEEILKRLESFKPESIFSAEEEGKGYACGHGALAAVMWAAKDLKADTVQVLRYATSGDITGDYSQVVGYGAAVLIKSFVELEEAIDE